MDEVFRVCDRATILRDGRKVADVAMAETTEAEVVSRMVGRELAQAEHKGFATDAVALEVENLSRGLAVRGASFQLRRGEVLGISGLVGAGRTELLRLVAGVDRPDGGTIRVDGRPLASAIRARPSAPGSASCPRSASATASSPAARSAPTSPCRR